MERLQKYLASCGIASRRKCEELIASGCICVNGKTVTQMGISVDPEKDKVLVNGRQVFPAEKMVYYALNKPAGYVVTVSDSHGTPTVMDLMKDVVERVFPVGRLDLDSEGLLILTNDGELANKMMHPRYHLEKEYIVTVRREVNDHNLRWLRKGILLDGKLTQSATVDLIRNERHHARYRVIIKEGRKRQIREMFKSVGHPVLALKRVAVGPIQLAKLPLGKYRSLTRQEIQMLRSALTQASAEKKPQQTKNEKKSYGIAKRLKHEQKRGYQTRDAQSRQGDSKSSRPQSRTGKRNKPPESGRRV
ncbi:MAG TPA: pseudouridine synthase [Candidatus Sumerlaeota bacterium]|nr:pseudouridine synthase [Candidatus Sumerlaeota bacterium]